MAKSDKSLVVANNDIQLEEYDEAQPQAPTYLRGTNRVQNIRQVRDLARTFTIRSLNRLARLMDTSKDERVQIQAANSLLNRAWGNPVTEIQINEASTGDPAIAARAAALAAAHMEPDQLRGVMAALQDALGTREVVTETYEDEKTIAEREAAWTDPQLVTETAQVGSQSNHNLCAAKRCGHSNLEHENGVGKCDLCRCPLYDRPCTICGHSRRQHNQGFAEACSEDDCKCTGD